MPGALGTPRSKSHAPNSACQMPSINTAASSGGWADPFAAVRVCGYLRHLGYSHLKKRLARNPNTSAYPARTSSGCAGGNWPTHESPIACTAAPSGL